MADVDRCPECGEQMKAIRLLDRDESGERDLEYAAADARRRWYSFRLPRAGRVSGMMCASCGRIVLRGIPREGS